MDFVQFIAMAKPLIFWDHKVLTSSETTLRCYPPIPVSMTTLLNLLLFHGTSLMPPGCGVVASAMLFFLV